MQLSKKEYEALERWREHRDISQSETDTLLDELLRLFPVHTLNGMVIRWDDEITPERLIASGYTNSSSIYEILHLSWFQSSGLMFRKNKQVFPQPTNMGAVWQLMEKCGCTVKEWK